METGLSALQSAIKAGKEASDNKSNFRGPSYNYFTWKPGDKKILRFLTDDILVADFYEFIVSNDGNTKSFLLDPAKGDFVKKYMSPTPGLGWRKNFAPGGGYEEPKLRRIAVGPAVLRDEVPDGKGGIKVVDHFEKIEIKGNTYDARHFGIVQQSLPNFWEILAGMAGRYGGLTTLDYEITREGERFDTKYHIVPILSADDELKDPANVAKFYGYGRPWPKNPHKDDKGQEIKDPDQKDVEAWNSRFLFCPQTLAQWSDNFGSEDRAKFWLTPKDGAQPVAAVEPSGLYPAADEAQASPPPVAAVPNNSDTLMASLREGLMGNK